MSSGPRRTGGVRLGAYHRKLALMDERARHDRTLRLLEARLETLAEVCERAPRGELRFEPEIEAAAAATRHAVELGLISAREGNSIWAAVARRHPGAPWRRRGTRLLAA